MKKKFLIFLSTATLLYCFGFLGNVNAGGQQGAESRNLAFEELRAIHQTVESAIKNIR